VLAYIKPSGRATKSICTFTSWMRYKEETSNGPNGIEIPRESSVVSDTVARQVEMYKQKNRTFLAVVRFCNFC